MGTLADCGGGRHMLEGLKIRRGDRRDEAYVSAWCSVCKADLTGDVSGWDWEATWKPEECCKVCDESRVDCTCTKFTHRKKEWPGLEQGIPGALAKEDWIREHQGPNGECPHCGQIDCRCHEDVGS